MKKYDFKKIEKKWRAKWLEEKTYEPDLSSPKKPFYNLMMFPYPSAEGLHIGGVRTFTGVDIYGRFKRMQGHDVFEPIGLDGFGINAENYALKINKNPKEHSRVTEENFYRQLQEIGNGYAWDEKIETYDPEYYKWTQWLFIQLFKAGLAYRKAAEVNWCTKCLTVLANEQVVGGECERCSTKVIKKQLEQWFFKITDYTERLLQGLELIDWDEKIKIAQRNWIGKSEGALIKFPLVDVQGQEDGRHELEIFTTRPDTIFGATFMVISPERAKLWFDIGWQAGEGVKTYVSQALASRNEEGDEKIKTGIFSGVSAINPATKEKIPVWISNYVLGNVGTGAIMAVPAHDERDFEFAQIFNLPVIAVVLPSKLEEVFYYIDFIKVDGRSIEELQKEKAEEFIDLLKKGKRCYPEQGVLFNSGSFSGKKSEEVRWKMAETFGVRKNQYRLRDWLISRQRYWGPPIPMIWCDSCGKWLPEKEENLPVLLLDVKEFRPTGTDKSPLANYPEFYETTCPECGKKARRETDVSDTFLDSAWYYLRYLDPKNKEEFVSKEKQNAWLPVHMYIGGAEHSVLHLLYVRFISMVLHDLKLVDFASELQGEPIRTFRAHGLITKDGAKMSKSRGNVVNPDEYFAAYGADVMRMYLAFIAPLSEGGDFRDEGIRGLVRFLSRTWEYYQEHVQIGTDIETDKLAHKTIKKVTEDIEALQYNTAISALMMLLNRMEEVPSIFASSVFLLMLAPFAPHITEEIFEMRGSKETIHKAPWPTYNPSMLEETTFQLVIQVNGKLRDAVEVSKGISKDEAKKLALARPNIEAFIKGTEPKKIIFVPNRLINIVI